MELTRELFAPQSAAEGQAEAIHRPSLTYWQDAWRRLKKNKMAMAGLVVLTIMSLMAIIGPHMTPYSYSDQDLQSTVQPPSAKHWLGTDDLGRDQFTRIWMGARVSLFIGLMAALLDLIIGATYGGISGYLGGRVDDIMMRIVEVLYAIPFMILVILLMVIIGGGLFSIILAMSITGWVGMARLVRGQMLQLKEQEFVLAAKTLGADPGRIILRHLIPNTMGPILVSMTMTIPAAIFTEAFLSFIGLGVRMPLASWGTLANDGYNLMRLAPWMLLYPALAIGITMLAFNMFGDGLRDALDPRLRK
ncbi:MAG: ABC transporter permease [Firmicutes bacterium]|nr:ABC transporter permease [Bacillota bacterium]MCL5038457.1 ABC transporter permease [Bacillota bacterium]